MMKETEYRRRLLAMNRSYSERFVAQSRQRERYHADHPTNIVILKCMDGRVDVSNLTEMPIGVIYPFRNLGGTFDLGWTVLNAQIREYVRASIEKRRKIVFLVTYHFASESGERGCRGHDYDIGRAVASAEGLVRQIRRVFLDDNGIYPILVGIDTDRQTLIFHGHADRRVSMAELRDDRGEIDRVIRILYPDIHPEIVPDLAPLMRGNIRHLAKVRNLGHAHEDLEHRESIIAVGHGFEWLPTNTGIVINPLEGTLDDTIGMAGGILKENRAAGRISLENVLLFTSVFYEEDGYVKRLAVEHTRYLTRLALDSIRKFHPDLDGAFDTLTCVMRWQDRRLEVVED